MTLYRASHAPYILYEYLLIDNDLGDGEDIDRFVMPQGMLTPRIRVIGCTEILEFCMDRGIETSPYVTGFTRHAVSRRNISDSNTSNKHYKRAAKFGVAILVIGGNEARPQYLQ